jgi:hypothetical protein
VRHRQRIGQRLAVAAGQPVRPVRAHLRRRRRQGRHALGRPGRRRRAHLQNVSYDGDSNLADPIVAPFVTKTATKLSLSSPVDGLPASFTTTSVSDSDLWGNVYGQAHGGVCAASASS